MQCLEVFSVLCFVCWGYIHIFISIFTNGGLTVLLLFFAPDLFKHIGLIVMI